MARNRGFQKKIAFTHWQGSFAGANVFTAGTAAVNVAAAQHLPETLMRIRGEYVAYADGAQGPGMLARITQGIIQVPEGSGTTVTWSPETDSDAPWIWWDVCHIGYEEPVTDVVDIPILSCCRRVIDSKAMRKLRNTELQWVVENVTILNAGTVNVDMAIRGLSGNA